jgi:hypothetical protein
VNTPVIEQVKESWFLSSRLFTQNWARSAPTRSSARLWAMFTVAGTFETGGVSEQFSYKLKELCSALGNDSELRLSLL